MSQCIFNLHFSVTVEVPASRLGDRDYPVRHLLKNDLWRNPCGRGGKEAGACSGTS